MRVMTTTMLPDLLKTIKNGIGGTSTISYQLARDIPRAVLPNWGNQCWGQNSSTFADPEYINSEKCGNANGRPRPSQAEHRARQRHHASV